MCHTENRSDIGATVTHSYRKLRASVNSFA